MKITAEEIG